MANNGNSVPQIGINNAGSIPAGAKPVSSCDPERARRGLNMALMAFAAIGAGVVIQEGILTLSIPLSEQATTATETVMAPPRPLTQPPHLEAAPKSEASPSQPTHASCTTYYYAMFKTDKGNACARNPTLIMAHWGPPTDEWFRTRGGRFEVAAGDLASQSLCACLEARTAYSLQAGRSASEPAHRVHYGGHAIEIEKWVCADDCPIQTAEIEHEP